MNYRFTIRPEAEEDLAETRNWYESHRDGLGKEFLAAVDDVLSRIRESPESYPVIYRGVRWARLRQFPYLVYYRIKDDNLEVLAVLHWQPPSVNLVVTFLASSQSAGDFTRALGCN